MESRRGRITPASRRRGRPARLARFRPGATYVTHDDDNLRAASTSTSAAFASSERSMRWTNSWRHASRDLYPEVGIAPGTSIQDHSLDTPEQSADRGDRKLLTDLARESIIDFGVTRDRGFRTVGRIVFMASPLRIQTTPLAHQM